MKQQSRLKRKANVKDSCGSPLPTPHRRHSSVGKTGENLTNTHRKRDTETEALKGRERYPFPLAFNSGSNTSISVKNTIKAPVPNSSSPSSSVLNAPSQASPLSPPPTHQYPRVMQMFMAEKHPSYVSLYFKISSESDSSIILKKKKKTKRFSL